MLHLDNNYLKLPNLESSIAYYLGNYILRHVADKQQPWGELSCKVFYYKMAMTAQPSCDHFDSSINNVFCNVVSFPLNNIYKINRLNRKTAELALSFPFYCDKWADVLDSLILRPCELTSGKTCAAFFLSAYEVLPKFQFVELEIFGECIACSV